MTDSSRSDPALASSVLTCIAEPILATDCDARVVFMNPAAEELTGWTRAAAEGRHISEVLVPDVETGQNGCRPARDSLGRGRTVSFTKSMTLPGKTGRRIHAEGTASPL